MNTSYSDVPDGCRTAVRDCAVSTTFFDPIAAVVVSPVNVTPPPKRRSSTTDEEPLGYFVDVNASETFPQGPK